MGMHIDSMRFFSFGRLNTSYGLGRALQSFSRYAGKDRLQLGMSHYGIRDVFVDRTAKRVLDSLKDAKEFNVNPSEIKRRGMRSLINNNTKYIYIMGDQSNIRLFDRLTPECITESGTGGGSKQNDIPLKSKLLYSPDFRDTYIPPIVQPLIYNKILSNVKLFTSTESNLIKSVPATRPSEKDLLIEQLKQENATKRLEAVDRLGEIHNNDPVILQHLINVMLNDETPIVRTAAAKVLVKSKAIRTLYPLVEALGDADQRVTDTVNRSLFILGASTLRKAVKEALLDGLEHEKPRVRAWSALIIGKIEKSRSKFPDELSIVALIKAFSAPEELVRTAIAVSLASIGDIRMVEPILKAAREASIRKAIIFGLRKNKAVKRILQDIREIGLHHADSEIQKAAIEILCEFRKPTKKNSA